MREGSAPRVTTYLDYRAFLKDWLAFRKARETGFSMFQLSKDAGFSTGYLSNVTHGYAPLSMRAIDQMEDLLGLKSEDLKFFRNLVLLQESDDQTERVKAFRKIKRRLSTLKIENPDLLDIEYIQNWCNVLVREMTFFEDFKLDEDWIKDRIEFPVSKDEIRAAIEFLTDNGYVKKTKNGYVSEKGTVRVESPVARVSLTEVNSKMCDLQKQSITRIARDRRSLKGVNVGISAKAFEKIQSRLNEVLEEVIDIAERDQGSVSDVYRISLNLFPLASRNTKKEKTK